MDEAPSTVYGSPTALPHLSLSNAGRSLSDGRDYTAAFKSAPEHAGTAVIVVTGKGNYAGSRELECTVSPAPIGSAFLTAGGPYTFDGSAFTPDVAGSLGSGQSTRLLAAGSDFEVTGYSGNDHAGVAYAHVNGIGDFSGEADVAFRIEQADIAKASIKGLGSAFPYTGSAIAPDFTVELDGFELAPERDYTVSFSPNVNAGWVSVALSGTGDFRGTLGASFQITARDIAEADAEPIAAQSYTGSAITPAVALSFAGTGLEPGRDYTVSYTDNTNVGTAHAVVTGKGNFSGKLDLPFSIELGSGPYDIADADIAPIAAQAWTGSAAKPGVSASFAGKVLEEGSDYELAYASNDAPGKATVTVTGTGSFTGSVELPFDIVAKDLSSGRIQLESGPFTYTGSAIEPEATVFLNGKELAEDTDYTVTYTSNVNAGKATVTVNGTGLYGGAITTTFVISQAQISAANPAVAGAVSYGGKAMTPAVSAKFANKLLVEGQDYTVSYKDNEHAGDATAIVDGKGNFAGRAKLPFKILAADIASAGIADIPDQAYTGNEIKPMPSVTVDGKVLVRGTDYTLSYSSNTGVGEAAVTVKGKGDYAGEASTTFDIVPASLSNASIGTVPDAVYAGESTKVSTPKVFWGTSELVEGDDFTVSVDGTSAGAHTMTITGKGNFSGTATAPVTITAADISNASANAIPTQSYTGSAVKPVPSMSYAGEELVDGRDFECAYEDNVGPGKATVTVTGKNNYTGSKTIEFTIKSVSGSSNPITAATLDEIPAQTFTGTGIEPELSLVFGDIELAKGIDYEVTYSNNVNVTRTAVASITGKGSFTGNVKATFEIVAANIADADAQPLPEMTFTGSNLRPKPSLSFNGIKLAANTDYTLMYSSAIHVGEAYAVAMGCGNFTGIKPVPFEIVPADISGASVNFSPVTYSKAGADVSASVTLNNKTLVQDTHFTVAGSTAGLSVGTHDMTVKGIGDYTGEAGGKLTVKAASLASAEVSGVPETASWTGSPIEFDGVKVTLGDDVLTEGDDYTLSYVRNTDVGKATLYVFGANGYEGSSTSVQFDIVDDGSTPVVIDISGADVEVDSVSEYTGAAVKPDVKVTLDGSELTAGNDYKLTFYSNVNAGAAMAKVSGTGSYTGSKTVRFDIPAADIAGASTEAVELTYSPREQVPALTVTWNGRELAADSDYTVPVLAAKALPGSYNVELAGKGNFTGKRIARVKVNAASLANADVSGVPASVEEGDDAVTFENVKVSLAGADLEEGFDYELSYANNDAAGNASVTIVGKNGYAGSSKEVPFTITAKESGSDSGTGSGSGSGGAGSEPGSDSDGDSGSDGSGAGSGNGDENGSSSGSGSGSGSGDSGDNGQGSDTDSGSGGKQNEGDAGETTGGNGNDDGSDNDQGGTGDSGSVGGGSSDSGGSNSGNGQGQGNIGGSGSGNGDSKGDRSNSSQGKQQATSATQTMYRLYNRYSGEHFYTASASERDQLKAIGWNDEGRGWTAPAKSATPVYRLYNAYAGDHHYTTSASERDTLKAAGWSYEGVGWFSDDAKTVPLYRQYNRYALTGSHNYTTSQAENDQLVKLGWKAEGVGWYGV